MQQVPNPECSSSAASNNEARWSRIPRVQLLRNKNDQRVPLYLDQTVPVWPIPVHSKGHSTNASPSSRSSGEAAGGQEQALSVRKLGGRGHGELKLSRKWVSDTVWFRSIKGCLRAAGSEAHSFNVSEILRNYDMSMPDFESLNSSKWSGIEQDLFTCTPVDPKAFAVPTAADFITGISKNKDPSSEGLTLCGPLNRMMHWNLHLDSHVPLEWAVTFPFRCYPASISILSIIKTKLIVVAHGAGSVESAGHEDLVTIVNIVNFDEES